MDALGQQEVARVAVLGSRPAALVDPEALREQHPGVQERAVRQRPDDVPERLRARPARGACRASTVAAARFGVPRSAASVAVRIPRSSISALVLARVLRSSQRRSVAAIRPATSSSAAASAASARRLASRSRTGAASDSSGIGRRPAVLTPSSRSRSSGESMSTARCRRRRRSRTSTPASSRSQRGSALSLARSTGRLASTVAASAIAIASPEYALLDRAPASAVAAARNSRQSRDVAKRHRARTEDDQPARLQPRDEAPQMRAERTVATRRALHPGPRRRPGPRAFARCRSATTSRASSRRRSSGPAPAAGIGARMSRVTGAAGTLPSVAMERWRTVGRVRAYVGLGANVGDPTGTLAAAVHALARLPGVRLRGVSRLYATEPVGVTRPAGVPQRRRRAGRPGRPRSRHGRLGAAHRAQGARALVRPPGSASGGVRARSTSTCSCSAATASTSSARPRAAPTTRRRRRCRWSCRTSRRGSRLFVLAPLSDLAPGLVPPGWGETVSTAADRQRDLRGPRRGPPDRDLGRRWLGCASGLTARLGPPATRRPTAGRPAVDPGRTCGPCPRIGPAWSGRPSPASGYARRRRRTGHPGAARRS